MAKRISHKNVGEIFKLRLVKDGAVEKNMLIGYFSPTGNKADDTAEFQVILEFEDKKKSDVLSDVKWTVYRSNGRWAYGSSADVLVVVD